jgi:hypothetical protein
MKISEIFLASKTQYELDFVDIDVERDNRVYLDPFFISTRKDPWSVDTSRIIKSYFQYVIDLIRSDEMVQARAVLNHLNEPNETCLGMSRALPRGNGMGSDNTQKVFDSLLTSRAVQTGLVENLEDSAIFIEGIGKDKISDATTNIIRKCLLEYTINQCNLWGIPLVSDVASGFFWNKDIRNWDQIHIDRLVISEKAYLLVPKHSISFYRDYIDQQYYQHYVLNYLQGEHEKNNTSLVTIRTLKNGTVTRRVYKKDIKERDTPFSKENLRNFTMQHPDIFNKFQMQKASTVTPLLNKQLSDLRLEDITRFLSNLLSDLLPGDDDALKYHKLMIGILELIFYSHLTNPIKENEINQGRKRIDISMDNSANSGFFYHLHYIHQIVSRYVFIECKNYTNDPNNPEIDQLSGRFSANSSKFGILTCRSINNPQLLKQRCIDLWKQKNELVIVITDNDIKKWLIDILSDQNTILEDLTNKQRDIILS